MPEMLDSTSRITAICRERNIVVALMTDGRFSGGSVGLVIGHVGPEAAVGGPIGLLKTGDTVVVDLQKNQLYCEELFDAHELESRKIQWENKLCKKTGVHPAVGNADTRLLNRMRNSAVSASFGAGMHPGGNIWVSDPRTATDTGFVPSNKYKN